MLRADNHRRSILAKTLQLRDKRAELAAVRAEVARLQDAFRETHRELYDRMAELSADAEHLDRDIRREAVEAYQDSGYLDKHPAPGVAIRVMHRLVYRMEDAIDWAVRHRTCFILDVKAFEAMAEAALGRPGGSLADLQAIVRREDVVKSTVSPKLEEILRETGHA